MICWLVAGYLAAKAVGSIKLGPEFPKHHYFDADLIGHFKIGHHMPEKRNEPQHRYCLGCYAE